MLMTIPFRTMRFPETLEQRWRIQFERLIPRASEESYWPAYSQTVDGRLNQAAVLNGVRDVSPGRNIQLIPFAFVRSYDVLDPSLPGGPGFDDGTEDEIGLDAKVVLRDSFVLDMTLQPRLQPSRVRPAAGHRQRALRGELSRAAAVLPRERRLLLDRDAAAGHAPHRRSRGRREVHGHAGQVGHRRDADERRGGGPGLARDRSAATARPPTSACCACSATTATSRARDSCTRSSSSATATTRCRPPTPTSGSTRTG